MLEAIERILREEDVEGLVDMGAPPDEYDTEAEAIAAALQGREAAGEDSMLALLEELWARSFGQHPEEVELRRPALRRVAVRLLRER